MLTHRAGRGWFAILGAVAGAQAPQRLNPMIDLLEQKKPIFGVDAPSNRGGAGQAAALAKTPAGLAKEALDYDATDFLFSGSMERGVDAGLPALTEFVSALADAGALARTPALRLRHPLVVQTPWDRARVLGHDGTAVPREGRPLAAPSTRRARGLGDR